MTSVIGAKLPVQLISHCYMVCLSQIAPNHQFKQLSLFHELGSQVKEDTLKYLYTLLACVSCLPQTLVDDLDSLPHAKHTLVFLLCAFHTHLILFSPSPSPPQFYNLMYTLSQLLHSHDITSILTLSLNIQCILSNLYTCSQDIIHLYFPTTTITDSSAGLDKVVISQDFTLSLPSSSVSPSNYSNHILGIIDACTNKDITDPSSMTLLK